MPIAQPIDLVSDPRVEHKYATLNGHKYHYFLGEPKFGKIKTTVFLIHGWPDLGAGWRYQIPSLINLGCRVVVPDMMGYGGTDAPQCPPESISVYGFKQASDDIAELARQLGVEKIVLGGHDWGGMVVWRCAAFYPQLVSHLFAVCTPYTPPSKTYIPLEAVVKGPLPQFGYQMHLASGEVEKKLTTKDDMAAFLNGMYDSRTPEGDVMFSPSKGVLFDKVHKVGKTKLMTEKEMDYYASQYARNGLRGPCSWYRTREINWKDEQQIVHKKTIDIPTLFISSTRDTVLKPEMAKGMGALIPHLTMREVNATHWALTGSPDEVNEILKQWFGSVVFGEASKL